MWLGRELHHLGYFEDEVDAARAYDAAVLQHRGPAARTNFVIPPPPVAAPAWALAPGARRRWVAEIWDGQAYELLGSFADEMAAARAYDRACGGGGCAGGPMSALDVLASMSGEVSGCASARAGGIDPKFKSNPTVPLPLPLLGLPGADRLSPGGAEAGAASSEGSARLRQHRSGRAANADAEATAAAALAVLTAPLQDLEPNPSRSASAGARALGSGSEAGAPKSSPFKGVSWHKHSQKWYAYIQAGGRMRGLGYFGTQLAAALAHDAEARRVHGKKAVTNFGPKGEFLPHKRGSSAASEHSGLAASEGERPSASQATGLQQLLGRSASVSSPPPRALLARPPPSPAAAPATPAGAAGGSPTGSGTSEAPPTGAAAPAALPQRRRPRKPVRAARAPADGLPAPTPAAGRRRAGDSGACGSAGAAPQGAVLLDLQCAATAPAHAPQGGAKPLVDARARRQGASKPRCWGASSSTVSQERLLGSPEMTAPATAPALPSTEEAGRDGNVQEGACVPGAWAGRSPRVRRRVAAALSERNFNVGDGTNSDASDEWPGCGGSYLNPKRPRVGGRQGKRLAAGGAGGARVGAAASHAGVDAVMAKDVGAQDDSQAAPPKPARVKSGGGRAARRPGAARRRRGGGGAAQETTSGYTGVSWAARSRKWRAQIWYSNSVHHLGFFTVERNAARMYDRAVARRRGPSAPTNRTPDEPFSGGEGSNDEEWRPSLGLPKRHRARSGP
ncbi:hypothetical protein WJX81_004502 [Elliptochloris bilobata]|uniref:AP2/ERF domain-containing protein n=1 Tax=Elliptochloris bilobata TaxID=381761 RepID=A0AAW1R2Y8_9CHLO